MSTIARELIEIVDSLPEVKAREVGDFARLLQQQTGDREWERILADQRSYPKLDKLVSDALQEGPAEPLDSSRLLSPRPAPPSGALMSALLRS